MNKKISIVIPCYNEESNICHLLEEINKLNIQIKSYDFEVILVDDGSNDNTVAELQNYSLLYSNVFFIELSRNFGKDEALRAGIEIAIGDAVITMDADLQHPPQKIKEFIKYWEEGFEVVYTYRKTANPHVSWYQKLLSKLYYQTMNLISSIELEEGLSDFRLLDRKVVNVLNSLKEKDFFYRGIIKWIGFNQIGLVYTPHERKEGNVSYSMAKLTKLAVGSMLSFSSKPLLLATYLGLFFAFLAVLYIPYILISYLAGYDTVSGWASLIATIVFFGGLNLFLLGILSLYFSKLFMQSKSRPNYIINKTNYPNKKHDFIELRHRRV